MTHHDYIDFSDLEGGERADARQLLRMKIDDPDKYSAINPPCQLLPWLIGTHGIDLYVEANPNAYCRVLTKDIKLMAQDGYYVWAKQRDALKGVGRAIRNPFLIGVAQSSSDYAPVFRTPIKSPLCQTPMTVTWHRQPCTRFTVKLEDF